MPAPRRPHAATCSTARNPIFVRRRWRRISSWIGFVPMELQGEFGRVGRRAAPEISHIIVCSCSCVECSLQFCRISHPNIVPKSTTCCLSTIVEPVTHCVPVKLVRVIISSKKQYLWRAMIGCTVVEKESGNGSQRRRGVQNNGGGCVARGESTATARGEDGKSRHLSVCYAMG